MKHKFLDDVTQIFSDLFFALAFQEHKRQRAKHKVHRHEENQWHQLSGTAVAAWRHLDALTNQLSLPILVYSCINIPPYVNNHTCSPVRRSFIRWDDEWNQIYWTSIKFERADKSSRVSEASNFYDLVAFWCLCQSIITFSKYLTGHTIASIRLKLLIKLPVNNRSTECMYVCIQFTVPVYAQTGCHWKCHTSHVLYPYDTCISCVL